MRYFDQTICSERGFIRSIEWAEVNGTGGSASSTIACVNGRPEHGLLTIDGDRPGSRQILLSEVEERLIVDGRAHDLRENAHRYLKEFRIDPFPVFTFQADGIEIEKRVFVVHGENTTVLEYEFRSLDREPAPECYLELRPLTEHGVAGNGGERVHFAHNGREPEDGRVVVFALHLRTTATLIASTAEHQAGDAAALREREIRRRSEARVGQALSSGDLVTV